MRMHKIIFSFSNGILLNISVLLFWINDIPIIKTHDEGQTCILFA